MRTLRKTRQSFVGSPFMVTLIARYYRSEDAGGKANASATFSLTYQ
jgi:type 1 fimbria pilin